MKLVYKDYLRHQQSVDLLHMSGGLLCAGSITWKVCIWGSVKCGLYKQVVLIYRWSLEQVWTVCCILQSFRLTSCTWTPVLPLIVPTLWCFLRVIVIIFQAYLDISFDWSNRYCGSLHG